jgi:hypothetical protein
MSLRMAEIDVSPTPSVVFGRRRQLARRVTGRTQQAGIAGQFLRMPADAHVRHILLLGIVPPTATAT